MLVDFQIESFYFWKDDFLFLFDLQFDVIFFVFVCFIISFDLMDISGEKYLDVVCCFVLFSFFYKKVIDVFSYLRCRDMIYLRGGQMFMGMLLR